MCWLKSLTFISLIALALSQSRFVRRPLIKLAVQPAVEPLAQVDVAPVNVAAVEDAPLPVGRRIMPYAPQYWPQYDQYQNNWYGYQQPYFGGYGQMGPGGYGNNYFRNIRRPRNVLPVIPKPVEPVADVDAEVNTDEEVIKTADSVVEPALLDAAVAV